MVSDWGQGIHVHLNCVQLAALISAGCSSCNPESGSVELPFTASVFDEKSPDYFDCNCLAYLIVCIGIEK